MTHVCIVFGTKLILDDIMFSYCLMLDSNDSQMHFDTKFATPKSRTFLQILQCLESGLWMYAFE